MAHIFVYYKVLPKGPTDSQHFINFMLMQLSVGAVLKLSL